MKNFKTPTPVTAGTTEESSVAGGLPEGISRVLVEKAAAASAIIESIADDKRLSAAPEALKKQALDKVASDLKEGRRIVKGLDEEFGSTLWEGRGEVMKVLASLEELSSSLRDVKGTS